MKNISYLLLGILFGITLIKSQVVSWYRIQEMFLFDNFHMYGVIGVAVVTASISLLLIRKFKVTTFKKLPISFATKEFSKGTIYGGILFGLGWSIIGACPGPMYALFGNGATIYLLSILAALAGVFVYGITIGKKKVTSK